MRRKTAIQPVLMLLCLLFSACSGDEAATRSGGPGGDANSDEKEKASANGEATTSYTYYLDVQPILYKYCVDCHGPSPAEGAGEFYRLNVYEAAGFLQGAYDMRGPIKSRMLDGSMPPAGNPTPSQAEVDLVVNWVDGGAPAGDKSDSSVTNNGGADNTNGVVAFVAPGNAAVDAPDSNDIYTVRVSFNQYYESFFWDLGYHPEGDPSNKTYVGQNIASSRTEYTADLSGAASGPYVFFVEAEGKSFTSTGVVEYNNPGAGNSNPSVTLTGAWAGAGAQIIGTTNEITYTALDPDADPLTVKIDISTDGGNTYSIPVTANAGSNSSFTWDAAAAGVTEGTTYRVKLTVTDGVDAGKATVTSSSNVGLATKTYTWAGDVKPNVLDPLCDSCHSNRPYDSDLYDTPNGAFAYRGQIVDLTVSESMPTNNNKANATQKRTLQLWLMQGAPEN